MVLQPTTARLGDGKAGVREAALDVIITIMQV